MIQLHNNTRPSISFSPRQGFRRETSPEDRDLIYGHRCPVCANVIQAFFLTPAPLRLWPFEETTVLSQGEKNMGDVLKVVPNHKSDLGDTCYRSYFYPQENGKSAQRIVLKNHLLRPEMFDSATFDREILWEPGERTCPLTGSFSMREDLAIKDVALILNMPQAELREYNIPKIRELLSITDGENTDNSLFRMANAIGQAPPVLLVPRETVNQGYPYYFRNLLHKYKKPVEAEAK